MSPSRYAQIGQKKLLDILHLKLLNEGRNPYIIPVGGSNALGAWGYIEAVREMIAQMEEPRCHFDHIIFACGSGGTATGIALACRASGLSSTCRVHAVAVSDSPEYFYKEMEDVCAALGVDASLLGSPREWCSIYSGQGLGYARSTDEELRFVCDVSRRSTVPALSYDVHLLHSLLITHWAVSYTLAGISLDPVYSGKALYHFMKVIRDDARGSDGVFREGDNVLFLHTGGVLGMYDKVDQLLPLLSELPENTVEPLQLG